ncbi:hypothetical protein SADUNF_Sadunf05G0005700 [Salix dunnii]|uniref:Rx N-terminal domain-containing protein n=1 Tax=Salix dunnii TaxID=1413687 RepID=A0A835KAT6_9ROSI|nr:hypothetical protein SADUNF_Sadunf05G0005700 [Salix dunnii]
MEEILTRVSSKAAEGIRFAWGLEGHLQDLIQSLTMIKVVLQDAARRPVTDDSLKFWLEMLQDVAYDAEDVPDEFAYEVLRKDQQKDSFLYSSEVLIGREEDVSKVMKLLIGSIDQQHVLSAVSIVEVETRELHTVFSVVDVLSRSWKFKSLRILKSRRSSYQIQLSDEDNEDVLKGLQPHSGIRSITVEGYTGGNFPSWMSLLQLNNLMELRLKDCSK